MKPPSRIVQNIITLRKRAGLSRGGLGKLINKSATRVGDWERGLYTPGTLVLDQIAKALGIKIEDILNPRNITPKITDIPEEEPKVSSPWSQVIEGKDFPKDSEDFI